MQNHQSAIYQTDEEFDLLNFTNIYHDSAQNDPEITRARCAEVLSSSPLSLESGLELILVKSTADRNTLLHALSEDAKILFAEKIRVVKKPGVFFSNYTGVEYVDVEGEKLKIQLSRRKDGREVRAHFAILDAPAKKIIKQTPEWEAETSAPWVWSHGQGAGQYLIRITLEGILAYEALFSVTT